MSLRALLDRPFGPYKDSIIFTDKVKSTRRGFIAIDDLYLTCADQEIGCVASNRSVSLTILIHRQS